MIILVAALPALLLAGLAVHQQTTIKELKQDLERVEPEAAAFAAAWEKYLHEQEGSEAAGFHLKVACGHARQIRLEVEFSRNPRALYSEVMSRFNEGSEKGSLAALCRDHGSR